MIFTEAEFNLNGWVSDYQQYQDATLEGEQRVCRVNVCVDWDVGAYVRTVRCSMVAASIRVGGSAKGTTDNLRISYIMVQFGVENTRSLVLPHTAKRARTTRSLLHGKL
jgi:hypothetical protein